MEKSLGGGVLSYRQGGRPPVQVPGAKSQWNLLPRMPRAKPGEASSQDLGQLSASRPIIILIL